MNNRQREFLKTVFILIYVTITMTAVAYTVFYPSFLAILTAIVMVVCGLTFIFIALGGEDK